MIASATTNNAGAQSTTAVIDRAGLGALIAQLSADGYRVIGPRQSGGAVILDAIESVDDLPAGWVDQQSGGHYRLKAGEGGALFGFGPVPQSWKRFLYPPEEKLWEARRHGQGFTVTGDQPPPERYAFLGVRACDLAAITILDRVLDRPSAADPRYGARRRESFTIAVACGRAGGTCFCASMGTGPVPTSGFDLALTELVGNGRHEFLVQSGSLRGDEALGRLPRREAAAADVAAAETQAAATSAAMGREMVPDVAALLARHLDHEGWEAIGQRCLACGNCTSVCPTCFCATVEDVTNLAGTVAERWRRWDSCFTLDFSYVHGGAIRRRTESRYRQWMTHKLMSWHDQFGSSGCVGCGRCITWCPVGIDITEEARAIRDGEGRA